MLKCWAGPAAKESLVLEWVKSHLWKGSDLRQGRMIPITFITEFGLICSQQRKILFYMQLYNTDN